MIVVIGCPGPAVANAGLGKNIADVAGANGWPRESRKSALSRHYETSHWGQAKGRAGLVSPSSPQTGVKAEPTDITNNDALHVPACNAATHGIRARSRVESSVQSDRG